MSAFLVTLSLNGKKQLLPMLKKLPIIFKKVCPSKFALKLFTIFGLLCKEQRTSYGAVGEVGNLDLKARPFFLYSTDLGRLIYKFHFGEYFTL